jgi:O-antigen ligase
MSHYALEAFQQHPWLGVGYENYNFYTGQRYYYGLYDFNLNWPEVNNYPLKVLTELGIVGMFCFVILNITFYYTLLKAISHAKDIFLKNLLNCFFAGSVGIIVVLLFSSSITKPYLWVFLAVGISAINFVENENVQGEHS